MNEELQLSERTSSEPEPDEVPVAPAQRFSETFFRLVPAFDSLRRYSLTDLRADFLAGLTVAAVAVPQAMAYALVVGTPPEYGLYTAIVMTLVGALFDSSRQLINGPTNAIAIALLSALAPIAASIPDKQAAGQAMIAAAILLAFLVGLIQTGITLLRLGDLTRFVSHSVIVGFMLGAGVLLILDQIKHLLGVAILVPSGDYFLTQVWTALASVGSTNGWTFAIGIASILIVLGLRWLGGRWGVRLPEFLIVIVLAAVAVWLFDLEDQGVKTIGEIRAGLPGFKLPRLDPGFKQAQVRSLIGSALAIAVLGLLEAIAMAKAIASQTGQKLDINQQCLSEGLANLTGSFFQCFPGSGSLTRSAINQQAGAVSQWSGVISAVAVAGIVLLFAPFARYIPHAALAGILMVSAFRLIDRKQLVYHLRATKFDAGLVIVTALAAIIVSVEFCILIGVFLSFMLYVPRAARLHMSQLTMTPERVLRERVATDPPCNRILIWNLEGELFFGASPDLERHLEKIENLAADGAVRVIVLRMRDARNPDGVCLHLIGDFIRKLEQRKVAVLLCGVRADLMRAMVNTHLATQLGPQRVFRESKGGSSTLDAVRAAYDLLGGDLCSTCPRREESGKDVLYYMI